MMFIAYEKITARKNAQAVRKVVLKKAFARKNSAGSQKNSKPKHYELRVVAPRFFISIFIYFNREQLAGTPSNVCRAFLLF